MLAFDKFDKREDVIRMTIEIEDILYDKLNQISKNIYDASVNKLINAAIEHLIETENIQLHKKEKITCSTKHSLLVRQSLSDGLEELKKKFDIPLYKLVNMSIRNAIIELENKGK